MKSAWWAYAVAVALYLPALFIAPFGDDWHMFAWVEEHGRELFFSGINFRVWQRILFALTYPGLGGEGAAVAVRIVSIAAHLAAAWLVAGIARRSVPGLAHAPLFAALLYLFNPANVSALIQVDTVSQALASALGLVAVRVAIGSQLPASVRLAGVAAAAALAALFAKETVLGVLAWIPFAAALHDRYALGQRGAQALSRGTVLLVAVGGAIVLFLMLRLALGTPFTPAASGRYGLSLDPANIAANTLLLTGAGAYYGNSAAAMAFGLTPAVLIGALVSGVLGLAAAWGARAAVGEARHDVQRRRQWLTVALWASFALAACVPSVLLGGVSELYAASLTPFLAIALGALLARAGNTPPRLASAAAWCAVAAAAGWGAVSIATKIHMHREVSARSWEFVRVLRPLLPACAERTLVVEGNLADTTSGGRPYSGYSAMNERIVRNALYGLTEPHRAAYLARVASNGPADSSGQDVGAARCDVSREEGNCLLRCTAGPILHSPPYRCAVLDEYCRDRRG